MSHQSYLEAPYVEAARMEAAFEQFVESTGIDPDEYDAADVERMFDEWVEDMSEPPEPDYDDYDDDVW